MKFVSQPYQNSLDYVEGDELLASHVPLGYHPKTKDDLLVPNDDRHAGMYVPGVSGSGKSALLENCIIHDALYGHAVIVIDPHGDLAMNCLHRLPNYVLDRVYLLDMQDVAYPFGVNVFADVDLGDPITVAQAIDRVMHVFFVQWPDIFSQQHLPRYLRAATAVLLANPGTTLIDMHRMLFDDTFRHELLANIADPDILHFWREQYDKVPKRDRLEFVRPLVTRLEILLMGRSIVRNIVGQPAGRLNFRSAIENKEVILIKLPLKTLPQDARLIGTMLMAQIHAAIFSFGDLPLAERPGVSLYVDEFQNFATPDFAELFTEGRKFGVRMTVAHQYRNQLPDYLQDSTMTAQTKVCFKLTPGDARDMADFYLHAAPVVKPEDVEPHPAQHLMTYGSDDPNVQNFIDLYLRPLQAQLKGRRVEVYQAESLLATLNRGLQNKPRPADPKVDNPITYLDPLLYEVMKTGQTSVFIRPEIVYGFSGCGYGFYSTFLNVWDKAWLLSDEVSFAPHLVVQLPDGRLQWTRKPENSKEELYHFIFHLRMTIWHLVAHPIGTRTTLTKQEVSQMLTHLPRRAAFVQSGDEVGVIYTHKLPAPGGVGGPDERLETIRAQTRAKYCRPKAEVAGELVPPVETMTVIPRWDEVE